MFQLTTKVSLTFSYIKHFPDSTLLFLPHNYEQSSNSFFTFKPCSPSSSDFLCKFSFSRLLLSELFYCLFLTPNLPIDFILHLQLQCKVKQEAIEEPLGDVNILHAHRVDLHRALVIGLSYTNFYVKWREAYSIHTSDFYVL